MTILFYKLQTLSPLWQRLCEHLAKHLPNLHTFYFILLNFEHTVHKETKQSGPTTYMAYS